MIIQLEHNSPVAIGSVCAWWHLFVVTIPKRYLHRPAFQYQVDHAFSTFGALQQDSVVSATSTIYFATIDALGVSERPELATGDYPKSTSVVCGDDIRFRVASECCPPA